MAANESSASVARQSALPPSLRGKVGDASGSGTGSAGTRPLTGRTVLICLLAFFGVIIGVNAVMIRAAVTTFGGVETGNAYRAGLEFNREIAAAQQQEARHWQVSVHAERNADGRTAVDLRAMGEKGEPLAGLVATARFAHPTDARLDRSIELAEAGGGRFSGNVELSGGHWNLVIDLMRGDQRVFRSRSRIVLN